ncbi:putative short chain dehydrogenase [Gorgonomyces haynaldii]|nr:putative short chain dehydrogenase [Gorgonomyces haynaldii]
MQTAVVVGVGAGLGASIAHKFAANGFHVALLARNKEYLQQLKQQIELQGGRASAITCDVSSRESIEQAFQQVKSELKQVDCFVYSPSAFERSPFLEASVDKMEQDFKVLVTGAFIWCQKVIPLMLERQSGTILFTGATAALKGGKNFASFAIPKFGVRALSQSLAREFGPQGIHVAHIIVDGVIKGPRTSSWGFKDEDLVNPEHLADAYLMLHQQKKTAWTQELDLRPFKESF